MGKLNIFILGCTGIPARYGGFETFAENLSFHLAKKYNVFIACSKHVYKKNERQNVWKNINRFFVPFKPNGFQSLLYDFSSIIKSRKKADFILMLGAGSGIALRIFRFFNKIPFAVHIDGLEWMRSKWSLPTKFFLKFNMNLCLKYADYLILDNEVLLNIIPEKYQSKIILSGYGCDHLPVLQNHIPIHNRSFALTIARAEPENNLQMIIEAFKSISHLDLIIVSNWKDTSYGKMLVKKYTKLSNIQLIGPFYNENERLQIYRKSCSVYIHGHSAGGTNPSLVEAMSAGNHVITFNNSFNRLTTKNLASYFNSSEELISLINLMEIADLNNNGEALQKIALQEYRWEYVFEKITNSIKEISIT
jgi:glycosyltransferase involved in cell wall biosynthesis